MRKKRKNKFISKKRNHSGGYEPNTKINENKPVVNKLNVQVENEPADPETVKTSEQVGPETVGNEPDDPDRVGPETVGNEPVDTEQFENEPVVNRQVDTEQVGNEPDDPDRVGPETVDPEKAGNQTLKSAEQVDQGKVDQGTVDPEKAGNQTLKSAEQVDQGKVDTEPVVNVQVVNGPVDSVPVDPVPVVNGPVVQGIPSQPVVSSNTDNIGKTAVYQVTERVQPVQSPNTPVPVSTTVIANQEVQPSNSIPEPNPKIEALLRVKALKMITNAQAEVERAEAGLKAAKENLELASQLEKKI